MRDHAVARHTGEVSNVGLTIRRGVAAVITTFGELDGALEIDSPQRILRGPTIRHGRVFLARARTMWPARQLARRTGHGVVRLWLVGAPVVYELDERAVARVEFGNGLVLMAAARRQGGAMRLTPLRRELEPMALVLVPS